MGRFGEVSLVSNSSAECLRNVRNTTKLAGIRRHQLTLASVENIV